MSRKTTGAPASSNDPIVAKAVDLYKTYGDTDSQVTALNHVSVDFRRGELTAIMGPSGSGKSTLMHCMADLYKTYGDTDSQVTALNHVSVDFRRGELTAIMGPSGSGKSTLMHCMAGLDVPTSGKVFVEDLEVSSMNQKQLTQLRRKEIGFIFQSFNLVPTLTAEENILLPLQIAHRPVDRTWFRKVVGVVGLENRLDHRPSQLSGGQQQRVACARAMMERPSVIFADEPTGNLDSRSSPEPAVGRPAAARRMRPRDDGASERHLRRRADGQPRFAFEPRGARIPAPVRAGVRPVDRHGHARPARGELRRPRARAVGRLDHAGHGPPDL